MEGNFAFKFFAVFYYKNRSADVHTNINMSSESSGYQQRRQLEIRNVQQIRIIVQLFNINFSCRPTIILENILTMSVHHTHCDNCVKINCDNHSCEVIDCRQAGCVFRMHECKQQDHLDNICSRVRVPCINSEFGCTFLVRRHDLRTHLERCPASAVSCKLVTVCDSQYLFILSSFRLRQVRRKFELTTAVVGKPKANLRITLNNMLKKMIPRLVHTLMNNGPVEKSTRNRSVVASFEGTSSLHIIKIYIGK